MYLVYTVVKSALTQQEVISLLPHKQQLKDYYLTRQRKDKERINSFFYSCDLKRFRRFELIMNHGSCKTLPRHIHACYFLFVIVPYQHTLWLCVLFTTKFMMHYLEVMKSLMICLEQFVLSKCSMQSSTNSTLQVKKYLAKRLDFLPSTS